MTTRIGIEYLIFKELEEIKKKIKKAPSVQHKPGRRMEGREEGETEQRRGTVYKRHGK